MGDDGPEHGRAAPAASGEANPEARSRELRHRFRNALQFLNSLVGLHARRTKDPDAREAFKDLRTRLVTLSWIYDQLDSGEEAEETQLADFLPRVAHHVAGLHDAGARRGLSFDVAEIRVSRQRAATLGQILAELLASLYARDAAGPRRSIQVALSVQGRRCRLEVAETGGVAEDGASRDQLAMIVVQSLAKNLDGRLEDGDPAGTAVLHFDAGPLPGDDLS